MCVGESCLDAEDGGHNRCSHSRTSTIGFAGSKA